MVQRCQWLALQLLANHSQLQMQMPRRQLQQLPVLHHGAQATPLLPVALARQQTRQNVGSAVPMWQMCPARGRHCSSNKKMQQKSVYRYPTQQPSASPCSQTAPGALLGQVSAVVATVAQHGLIRTSGKQFHVQAKYAD